MIWWFLGGFVLGPFVGALAMLVWLYLLHG